MAGCFNAANFSIVLVSICAIASFTFELLVLLDILGSVIWCLICVVDFVTISLKLSICRSISDLTRYSISFSASSVR